jgi:hypothetical protein
MSNFARLASSPTGRFCAHDEPLASGSFSALKSLLILHCHVMLPKTPEPALNPTRRRVYFERELGGRTRLLLYSSSKRWTRGK